MPLNPLKSEFRGRYPNSVIASYSYTDILAQTGQLSIYAVDFSSGTNSFVPTALYSHKGWTAGGATATFDITFNKTISIGNGNGTLNLPVGIIYTSNSVGTASNANYTWTISHINKNAVVTQLDTETVNFAWKGDRVGGDPDDSAVLASTVNFSALKQIRKGETIRLEVVVPADPTDNKIYLAHDPLNRTTLNGTAVNSVTFVGLTFIATRLGLIIPVKIDL